MLAGGAIGLLLLWVGSGSYFAATYDDRTLGLGEEPVWYPHAAVRFAGGEAMPDRFIGFPSAEASLYEYYMGLSVRYLPTHGRSPGRRSSRSTFNCIRASPRISLAGRRS